MFRGALGKRRGEHLASDDAISRFPSRAGHRLRILFDGPHTYDAMCTAFDRAQSCIHVVSYALTHGAVGERFADSLMRASARGVTVRLLYDSIGSFECSSGFLRVLTRNGVLARAVRPLHHGLLRGWSALNRRNHRKLAIVDREISFVGGVNVTECYRHLSRVLVRGAHRRPDRFANDAWRDTHLELHGPATADLDTVFLEDWRESARDDRHPGRRSGARRSRPAPDPASITSDDALVRVASSIGAVRKNQTFDLYASALARARSWIDITHAYFAPPPWLLDAVCAAARRGVDVRIIVPGRSDSALAFHAARSNYDRLLRAGVRLYEMTESFLHAKTMVVDGWWSIVGSANLDTRSWLHNDETCVVVYDESFATAMHEQFERDLGGCQQLSRRRWQRRPLRDRVFERATRPMYTLL
jgi:cardiolipin synthase